ncbi:MAG TPA: helix-turn-helix domain-containing protein [Spirochaetia bacterium]|nr:helix-turn-helix domain-containing protein [Spirochaetia bacterium]
MGICLVFIKACEKTLPVFVCGDLTLDFDLRQVSGRLQHELWRNAGARGINRLRVLIAQLRRKIERQPSRPELIFTEPGIGYRLGLDQ